MRAWRVQQYGHYGDELHLENDVAVPSASGAATLIRVLAAGVNFSDILAIAGKYQVRAPLPFTPGSEVVGEVVEPGGSSKLRTGQRVVAMSLTGGFGEFTAVADDSAFPVPGSTDPIHAAAMLVTYQTSHVALFRRANLRSGEWVLVHGGAGGVGTAAIQLAKRAGARVIAAAGGEEKLRVCEQCGAEAVIDYRREDFVERVKEITSGHGADVIFDPVGGDIFDASTKCLAREGRLLVVGFSSGRIPTIAANRILLKNISVVGVEWPSYLTHDRQVLVETQEDIWAGYREGTLRPVISRVLPLTGVVGALTAIEARESYGKIVIDVAGLQTG